MKTLPNKKPAASRNSRVDHTVERIREYIRVGNLQAGDRLPGELEIAQNLHVSRPVLREAISRLECLRLVEVRHGNGTFVAGSDRVGICVDFIRSALAISPRDLMQCAELRLAIECAAARMCAERATAEGMAELTELCAAMDRSGRSHQDVVESQFQFHRKIVHLTGNVLMLSVTDVLHQTLLTGVASRSPEPGDRANRSHLYMPMLHAIRDGNAEAAAAAMKTHLMRQLTYLRFNTRQADAREADMGLPDASGVLNSRVDRAAESIRNYILSENLQMGDRLPGELEIAESLKMSRRALREAISRLECLGLVEVRRGAGTFVASRDHLGTCVDFVRSALAIPPGDLLQHAELRFAMECAAARMCAERATTQGLSELTELCTAMDQPERSYLDAVEFDFEFHRKIVELTGNDLMQNLMEVLHRTIMAAMVHTAPQPRDRAHSRRHHEPILHAIREGNGDAAEAAMRRHMVWHLCRLPLNVRDANTDHGDVKIVEELYRQAHDSDKSIKARFAAVKNLSEIAKAPHVAKVSQTIKEKLTLLLKDPNIRPGKQNDFMVLVIGAIANLGPNGRELLPDLGRTRGQSAEVDAAIVLAEASLLDSPSFPSRTEAPEELIYQAKILNDLTQPVGHRLAAAKFFGDESIIIKYSDRLGEVIEPVLKAMKRDSDFDVRRVAAESANKALEHLRDKPASASFKNWTQQYISGLASMLAVSAEHDKSKATNLRIFAAKAIGDLAGNLEKYPEEFLVFASLIRAANPLVEPDPYLNSVAQKALDTIAGTDFPQR